MSSAGEQCHEANIDTAAIHSLEEQVEEDNEEEEEEDANPRCKDNSRRILIIYLCMVLAIGLGVAGQVARPHSVHAKSSIAERVHPFESFCNFTRIPVGLSWGDATPAQVRAVRRAIHSSTYAPRNPIFVYWHVYTDGKENRSQEVIDRQYALMRDSGLLEVVSEIRIGHVGTHPLVLPSWNKTRVVAHAVTGVECVTTSAMWEDMQRLPANESALLLYIHTRGVTHTAKEDSFGPNEGWTAMMEEVNVRRWRVPVALLDDPAETGVYTAGADKCYMGDKHTFGWLYPGNMWWASSTYIRGLMDPIQFSRGGNPYYMCSEQWILSVDEVRGLYLDDGDNTRDFVLFSAGVAEGKHGAIRMYIDPVPEGIASCSEPVFDLPSRKPCVPIDLTHCHGACCDLVA